MIDPAIRMVDVEPDGFAIVSQLMSEHLHQPQKELHVLHRDGVITRAVLTQTGVDLSLIGTPFTGARALYDEGQLSRVIAVDEVLLSDLGPSLAEAGSAPTQDEMFVRSRRTFLASPAVDVYPAPAHGEWERWSRHLFGLGDDYVGVIAGFDGGVCVFSLVARIHNGLVTDVTSLPGAIGTVESSASSLIDTAGLRGTVKIAVAADLSVFNAALADRSVDVLRTRSLVAVGLPDE